MEPPLALNRFMLADFSDCRRRFQLRYLRRYPWPEAPRPPGVAEVVEHGTRFHRLLQRHFLGIAVDEADLDSDLASTWRAFQQYGPAIAPGLRLPELMVTVPLGPHQLSGRFDLAVVDRQSIHIYDWKTGVPQSASDLRTTWQTKVYLALAYVGAEALTQRHEQVGAKDISLTYWFARDPEKHVTFTYSLPWHQDSWRELRRLADHINAKLLDDGAWPLTDNLEHCRTCTYRVRCGRQEVVRQVRIDEVDNTEPPRIGIEPELPG
jgi:hypothetical protein